MSTDPQSSAPWLGAATAELGQHELQGDADAPRILSYYRQIGHAEVRHDEVSWCAAFVGAMLEATGVRSTRSLMARSYLDWGTPLARGRPGAIAIFRRSGAPGSGHVAFWLAETGDRIRVLGGNQGDAVSVITMAKADLLGLRWPAPTAASAEASFDEALAHVLAMEGGWTDDPHDPGGPTNYGITLATFSAHTNRQLTAQTLHDLKADLRAITPATVRAIYRERYWQPCMAQALSPPLALMHFDAAVNHGVGGAARLLQRAVEVDVDGDIGPLTLAAAHRQPVEEVLLRYAAQRRLRYRSLGHFWRFGRGWLARVDATLAAARTRRDAPNAALPETVTDPGVPPMSSDVPDTTSPRVQPAKWWAHSVTVWGTLITALATVLPLLGPVLGVEIKPDLVRQLGDNLTATAQAVAGLAGTIMALYGRSVATARLERRTVSIPL
jgi:uncharacterized protein (TIGR02594 family)